MSVEKLIKLADHFENKMIKIAPVLVVPSTPQSRILNNIINDSRELLSIMNKDDRPQPQWADEALTTFKINLTKILQYYRMELRR